jgi:PTH1 family peptidyl-tRNA hydrolase
LGNPGAEYAATRHNAGFWLVDELARQYGDRFRYEAKFGGELCRVSVAGHPLWLLKPLTYMNRSGSAVAALVHFYKLALAATLVVHDELDLPTGSVRLKRGGGPGGHNGLRDLIRQLGTGDFLRLRLGIGHPGAGAEVINYVLRPPPAAERELIEEAISAALRSFPDIVSGHLDKAMNVLHSRKLAPVDDSA